MIVLVRTFWRCDNRLSCMRTVHTDTETGQSAQLPSGWILRGLDTENEKPELVQGVLSVRVPLVALCPDCQTPSDAELADMRRRMLEWHQRVHT